MIDTALSLPLAPSIGWERAIEPSEVLTEIDVTQPLDNIENTDTPFPPIQGYARRDRELAYRDLVVAAALMQVSLRISTTWNFKASRLRLPGFVSSTLYCDDQDIDDSPKTQSSAAHVTTESAPADALTTDKHLYERDLIVYQALAKKADDILGENSPIDVLDDYTVSISSIWSEAEGNANKNEVSPTLPLNRDLFKLPDQNLAARDNDLAAHVARIVKTLENPFEEATKLLVEVNRESYLDQLRVQIPCTGDILQNYCPLVKLPISTSVVFGGDPGTTYKAKIRVRGAVPLKRYSGGTVSSEIPNFSVGGTASTSTTGFEDQMGPEADGEPYYFNGGDDVDPGYYRITHFSGWYLDQDSKPDLFGFAPIYNDNLEDRGLLQVAAGPFEDNTALETAQLGRYTEFYHTGGKVGVKFVADPDRVSEIPSGNELIFSLTRMDYDGALNEFKIVVSSPSQTYWLNNWNDSYNYVKQEQKLTPIDYEAEITVNGGATVTLTGTPKDFNQRVNDKQISFGSDGRFPAAQKSGDLIILSKGTATDTASSKLIDENATFDDGTITIGDVVANLSLNEYSPGRHVTITAIDSATTLSLSGDTFSSGDDYKIYDYQDIQNLGSNFGQYVQVDLKNVTNVTNNPTTTGNEVDERLPEIYVLAYDTPTERAWVAEPALSGRMRLIYYKEQKTLQWIPEDANLVHIPRKITGAFEIAGVYSGQSIKILPQLAEPATTNYWRDKAQNLKFQGSNLDRYQHIQYPALNGLGGLKLAKQRTIAISNETVDFVLNGTFTSGTYKVSALVRPLSSVTLLGSQNASGLPKDDFGGAKFNTWRTGFWRFKLPTGRWDMEIVYTDGSTTPPNTYPTIIKVGSTLVSSQGLNFSGAPGNEVTQSFGIATNGAQQVLSIQWLSGPGNLVIRRIIFKSQSTVKLHYELSAQLPGASTTGYYNFNCAGYRNQPEVVQFTFKVESTANSPHLRIHSLSEQAVPLELIQIDLKKQQDVVPTPNTFGFEYWKLEMLRRAETETRSAFNKLVERYIIRPGEIEQLLHYRVSRGSIRYNGQVFAAGQTFVGSTNSQYTPINDGLVVEEPLVLPTWRETHASLGYVWTQNSTAKWMTALKTYESGIETAFRASLPGDIGKPGLVPEGLEFTESGEIKAHYPDFNCIPAIRALTPWMIDLGFRVAHEDFWLPEDQHGYQGRILVLPPPETSHAETTIILGTESGNAITATDDSDVEYGIETGLTDETNILAGFLITCPVSSKVFSLDGVSASYSFSQPSVVGDWTPTAWTYTASGAKTGTVDRAGDTYPLGVTRISAVASDGTHSASCNFNVEVLPPTGILNIVIFNHSSASMNAPQYGPGSYEIFDGSTIVETGTIPEIKAGKTLEIQTSDEFDTRDISEVRIMFRDGDGQPRLEVIDNSIESYDFEFEFTG